MRNLLKIDCLVIKKLTFLQNNMSRAYRCIFRKKSHFGRLYQKIPRTHSTIIQSD